MNRALLAAALLLPLAWLGGNIALHQHALAQAREWRIPVEGYDPRDPLRGQYVRFTLGWRLVGDPAPCETPDGCRLCLSESGGTVTATVADPGARCPHPLDPARSGLQLRPAFQVGEAPRFESRIFVSEASAPALEDQLRAGPMQLVAALAPDGRLIARRLEPQPRLSRARSSAR
jgi:hypothetical protein